jgi:5-methyltetrahydropteroyltriglutamate--homocysteine methyltransferase
MPPKSSLSPGGRKLASLGISLPPIPITASGSLPKQAELMELRYRVSKGVQQGSELDRKERLSTEVWIRQQEKMGLDVLVDGEMLRGDMIHFFAKKIGGFEEGGTVRSYGNRYYRKPIVKGKIEWKEPLVLDTWQFAQRMTRCPVKAVITGPVTLMDWSFNEHYASREALVWDLVEVLRKEILALAGSGAKIIQIDEPSLSANPEEFSLVQDAINSLTKGVKAYFILRHCYGDIAPLWKKMQKLAVDNFHLEMANSRFDFLSVLKKNRTAKDVTAGVIDSHRFAVESPREVADAIRELRKIVPAPQLWVSDDAGLKSRSVDGALAKMDVLAKTTIKQRALL